MSAHQVSTPTPTPVQFAFVPGQGSLATGWHRPGIRLLRLAAVMWVSIAAQGLLSELECRPSFREQRAMQGSVGTKTHSAAAKRAGRHPQTANKRQLAGARR